jgi:hypothetical protein
MFIKLQATLRDKYYMKMHYGRRAGGLLAARVKQAKSKEKSLGLLRFLGFTRPNPGFSMGYEDSK